jgi:hypothetical protein|nr:MAG TPA: hypothetical protein [Siphoviridae sp. cttiG1]
MLHLCIPRKDGHEVHVPVNEYTQFIASWIVGAYLTNEKRDRHTMLWLADEALREYNSFSYGDFATVHTMRFVLPMSAPLALPEALSHFEALSENRVNRGRRMDAVTKIRSFIQKELSCLKTSV